MLKPVHEIMRSVKLTKTGEDASNKNGITNKFWQAKIVGRMMIARWGPNGSNGQTKKYILSSIHEARDKLRNIIHAKMGNQYKMIYGF